MQHDAIINLLNTHNILPTQQRIELGQLLFARAQHLSAEILINQLKTQGSRISRATVYNTLNLFADKGLLNTVPITPSHVLYDTNTAPHYHLYDASTGELTDIACEQIHIDQLPNLPHGLVIDHMDIILHIKNTV
ncbi:MAG: transcriptional repressor [Gammaproteobacteria bacterium]|nr:transcriptional repressor [Gammaproteobacteria bacterium]